MGFNGVICKFNFCSDICFNGSAARLVCSFMTSDRTDLMIFCCILLKHFIGLGQPSASFPCTQAKGTQLLNHKHTKFAVNDL
jgi:hypothetical protein